MRRGPLVVLALVVLGLGLAGLGIALRVTPEPRSVVLVTIDTLRADRVGAFGRTPSPTPNLDALAARGAAFDAAWSVSPVTVPSHATMLTGLLPSQHGLRTNRPRHRLAPRERRAWATLAEAMRGAGCATAAFTSASVLRDDRTGLRAGFDTWNEVAPARPGSIYETERRAEETVAAASEWLSASRGPVFLWVHLFDPHAPYDAPPPWGAGAAESATEKGYDGEVAYADHWLGRLLDAVRASGRDDAVVAVLADHGEGLGEHGESTHGFLLHEATLRVPLVIAAPGAVPAGLRRADPVSTRDLASTVLALARVGIPEGMPGTPLFGRRDAAAPLYAETLYGHEAFRWAQAFAVRVGPWKVVDAGPEVLECDLSRDPRETGPRRHAAAALPEGTTGRPVSVADAVELARRAATGEGAPVGDDAAAVAGGGYFGGGATLGPVVLPPEENRLLPSPYERIAGLVHLERGQAHLLAGSPDRALAEFGAWAAADPGNPQAWNWRGRALLAMRRAAEAAESFRKAFELGWTSGECVEKALQASALSGDPAEPARGIAFAELARGRNVPDTGMAAVLEAALHLLRGDRTGAAKALDRARTFPATPELDRAIRETDAALGNSR